MKKTTLKSIAKFLILFAIGGFTYNIIELIFRGYTFFSMFIVGGLCFTAIGQINEAYPWDMPLISQMAISSVIVTVVEFCCGIILNMAMGLHVWDYSDMPYNFCGQVCLIFSIGWFFLSAVAIILDDVIRWKLFGEEKPRYHIFYSHCEDMHKDD